MINYTTLHYCVQAQCDPPEGVSVSADAEIDSCRYGMYKIMCLYSVVVMSVCLYCIVLVCVYVFMSTSQSFINSNIYILSTGHNSDL